MFGKVFTAVVLISCVACAKPRWAPEGSATPPPDASQNGGQNTPTAACELKFKSGLCLEWAWEKQPADSEFGSLIFKTYREENGQAVLQDLSGFGVVDAKHGPRLFTNNSDSHGGGYLSSYSSLFRYAWRLGSSFPKQRCRQQGDR